MKRCRSCTFIKFYFLIILVAAITVRFYTEYSGIVNTLLMVGIPVVLLRKSAEELGIRNFFRGLTWGISISALVLPIYFIVCSRFNSPVFSESSFINSLIFFLGVAVAEEIFFRGYLYSEIENEPLFLGISKANFISSFLFALAHVLIYYNPVMFKVFLPSLIMGWLYERSGSILAPIVFHWLSDVIHSIIPCYVGGFH